MEELIKQQNKRGKAILAEIVKLDQEGCVTRGQLEKHQSTVQSLYKAYYECDQEVVANESLGTNNPYSKERKQIQRAYDKFIDDCNGYLISAPINSPKAERKSIPKPTSSTTSAGKSNEDTMKTISIDTPSQDTSALRIPMQNLGPPARSFMTHSSEANSDKNQALFHEQDVNMRLLYRRLDTIRSDWESGKCSQTYAKIKVDQINKDLAVIDQLHRAILINTTEEEQEVKYFSDDYYGELSRIAEERLITLHDLISNEPQNPTPSLSMRLPRIEVPIFYGEYEKWPSFKDLFTTVIHQGALSNTEKMCYLKAHVQKEAAKLISHLSSVDGNYEKAWSILQTRYDNKRLLASTYFNTLLSLHQIHQATASNIQGLHDTVVETLHNIQNLQLENAFEAFVGHLIMKKVNAETENA